MAGVRLGFEKTVAVILDVLPLDQDLCQKPTLCKFPHLHRFIVCFPLHVIVAFQMSTESIGNTSQLFPRQNLLDVMQVASRGNFWMSVANLSWI